MSTREDWVGSIYEKLNIGQLVDQPIIQELVNILPPKTLTNILFQVGEPYSYVDGQETFITFSKESDGWTYRGMCFEGETMDVYL